MIRLTEEDGQAVDWYLWARSSGRWPDGAAGDARLSALPSSIRSRVDVVARLFDVLGAAPEPDVPENLAGRTIKAIELGAVQGALADEAMSPQQPTDLPANS